MKKKKLISLIMTAALAAGSLAGCGNSADSVSTDEKTETEAELTEESNDDASAKKEDVTVRLADMSVYGIAIFNYAEEIGLLDGYFDDLDGYNVTVELSDWASGPDQNTAFAAGEIDFSVMGNIPAVTGASNNYGTKIIAVNWLYDDEYVLVAREGSGIESVEDLAGHSVGTYVGTVTHYAVAKYLEYGGLTINDVELLSVGAETATSLRSGDIDAGVLGLLDAQQLQQEGTANIVASETVQIYNYVIGNEEFIEKYPEIAVRVLQLINDTWDYALEHQDEYIEFFAGVSGINEEYLRLSWEDNFPVKNAKDFDDDDYAAYIELVDWLKSVEYVSEDIDPDSLLDLTYVKQL